MREAFADKLMEEWPNTIRYRDAAIVTADAFLDMPEMSAIRRSLLHLASYMARDHPDDLIVYLRRSGLPPNVMEWIFSDLPEPWNPC